jgi:uncharacterized protein
MLKGQSIILTGASSGFGAVLSRKLAARGARVALLARRKDLLDRLAEEIRAEGGTAYPLRCDVTDPQQVERTIKEAVMELGTVDVLVNNAGIMRNTPLQTCDLGDISAQFETHVFGAINCTRAVLPVLLAKGRGQIVNISSASAWMGPSQWSGYAASKAALMRLTQVWRWELQPKGIMVTGVYPYYTLTDMLGEPGSVTVRERFPLMPVQKAEKVADAILKAIDRNQREVFIPGYLRYWMLFPVLTPAMVDVLVRKFPFGWPGGQKSGK